MRVRVLLPMIWLVVFFSAISAWAGGGFVAGSFFGGTPNGFDPEYDVFIREFIGKDNADIGELSRDQKVFILEHHFDLALDEIARYLPDVTIDPDARPAPRHTYVSVEHVIRELIPKVYPGIPPGGCCIPSSSDSGIESRPIPNNVEDIHHRRYWRRR